MKWVHWIAAGVFGLCAVLQWNDPDSVQWMLVYGLAALAAASQAAGLRAVTLMIVALIVSVGGLAVSAPGAMEFLSQGSWSELVGGMSEERPWVESAREFIGALIVLDYLVLALVLSLKGRRKSGA